MAERLWVWVIWLRTCASGFGSGYGSGPLGLSNDAGPVRRGLGMGHGSEPVGPSVWVVGQCLCVWV